MDQQPESGPDEAQASAPAARQRSHKRPKDIRELCYPFIYETQLQCDYEIATDELCCQVGAVMAMLPAPPGEGEAAILADLDTLQRLIYNLNGSVRGRLGIFEADLDWLKGRYDHYNEASRGRVTGFVLPRGPQPIPALHLCRCASKKVVRLLVRLEESGVGYDPILARFANLLANFFFVLTVYLKQAWNVPEVPYVSINY
ncbi:ATP--cob(I)alamin adenosyltransferase [Aeromonas bivalvium]|uniref:ATP--cob(I)alamin adenosyltransferase n=1 Tax=Aeromonas bivalvium TaxID=440079 RepID=A0ABW9GUF1_9GAMM